MWRNRFGRGFGPVVWQITDDDDDDDISGELQIPHVPTTISLKCPTFFLPAFTKHILGKFPKTKFNEQRFG